MLTLTPKVEYWISVINLARAELIKDLATCIIQAGMSMFPPSKPVHS